MTLVPTAAPAPPPYDRFGPAGPPASPLVIAVPHAGRDYPPALIADAAVPRAILESLEDRFADRLIGDAVAAGAVAFVARPARAWIDLNRDEGEIDPAMLVPGSGPALRLTGSAKMRGGLGLIPRRLHGSGDLLRRRLSGDDVARRIVEVHRPWHAALAAALAAAQVRFGVAILLDCHSMPPLVREPGNPGPRIVIGDRHGRSASRALVDRLTATIDSAGIGWRINDPYAGGHALERHGRPGRGHHAIQIEIDRSLYLDADLRTPSSAGLAATTALIGRCAEALVDWATPPALAAE